MIAQGKTLYINAWCIVQVLLSAYSNKVCHVLVSGDRWIWKILLNFTP